MKDSQSDLRSNPNQGAIKGVHFYGAILLSFLIYYTLFGHVLHKPQTVGQHQKLIQAKTEALSRLSETRKVIVLAGSNGRVSHSAGQIEAVTGIPSVNMSVTASMSIDFQLNRIKSYLHEGDIIYMPLEYGQLTRSQKAVYSGIEAPYVVAYEKASLKGFSPMRKLHAYFYFDLKFLFSAIAEMGLSAMDFKRRITADDFNAWGDQVGHTIEKGLPYADYINGTPAIPASTVRGESYAALAVSDFLHWAKLEGIVVVGGYPTFADGERLDFSQKADLKNFYIDRGHYFLDLENMGRYPKSHFFDTIYHLAEPYQIEHSRLVGIELKQLLNL
ncbi:MAG TPA: hypothetical protein DCX06_02815 [Opitutae bacterium]|nr:hypothetical protein [Opitutae bacterium]